ncbi:MAG: biotin/lipoyl-containing protein [Candidatus Latescibacterota bacterium]
MGFNIVIDGIEKEINLEKKGDHFLFTVGGNEYPVSAQPLTNGAFTFFVGKRSFVANLSNGDGGKHLTLGGRRFFIAGDEQDGDSRAGAGASTQSDGKVESPMPGNIIAVHVKEGDTVEADQAVVVIESMKMQNEITAPVEGEVKKVNCSVGDQVSFGEVLVEISPKE